MAKLKTGPKVKRKGGGVAAKAKKVESLAGELSGTVSLVVTEYRGLKVTELQELRRRLRPRGIEYHVVKNSLFARAAEQSGKGELRSILAGPTAVAIGNGDEVERAKSRRRDIAGPSSWPTAAAGDLRRNLAGTARWGRRRAHSSSRKSRPRAPGARLAIRRRERWRRKSKRIPSSTSSRES